MTAPLTGNTVSLHVLTNKLLNAIDDDEIAKVEAYIDDTLRCGVSQNYFCMLYRYAEETEKIKSCHYLQEIIHTNYNF